MCSWEGVMMKEKALYFDGSQDGEASPKLLTAGQNDVNYASAFLRFTNEVINKCTPDREFDARIHTRLKALVGVYQSRVAEVINIDRNTLLVDVIFSAGTRTTAGKGRTIGLQHLLDKSDIDKLEEDAPVTFVMTASGKYVPATSSDSGAAVMKVMCYPFVKTDEHLWSVIVVDPQRFSEYTLSICLAGDAIKTELSKRMLLEQIAGGKTAFLQAELDDDSIFVKMLGTFSITRGRTTQSCYDIGGRKCTLLLANLLLYQRRLISTQEIRDILLANQVVDNPASAVKSVVFRIRKAFRPLLESDIVVTHHGSYSLNQDFNFILDISQFELFCSMAKKRATSEIEQLAVLEYAIKQYRGDLLPGLEGEATLLGHITYYRLLFDEALEKYLKLLVKSGQYKKVFKTISHITAQRKANPELHRILLRTLISMDRLDLSNAYFDNFTGKLPYEQRQSLQEYLEER